MKSKEVFAKSKFKLPEYCLSPVFIIGSLLLLGFLAYSNSFRAEFHLDDFKILANTQMIREYLDLPLLWQMEQQRFFAYLTFAFNYRIWQFDHFSYHCVNWLIHLGSATGVFFLLRLIFSQTRLVDSPLNKNKVVWMAWTGALFFLLHPLQTMAVVYVVQRMASLVALLYILTVLFYGLGRQARNGGWRWYSLSVLCALLALFTKQNAFSLPGAIVAYELCFASKKENPLLKSKESMLALGTVFLLPVGVYLLFFSQSSANGGLLAVASDTSATMGRWEYFLTQQSVIAHYLRLVLWPVGQNADYDWPIAKSFFEARTMVGFGVLVSLFIAGIVSFKKGMRDVAFGIFFFFIALSIESSVIPIEDVIFEHRMYLPMAGLSCLFAILLKKITDRVGNPLLLMMVTLLPLGFATYQRNEVWKTDVSLWTDVMHKSPQKARPYANLAYALSNKGAFDQSRKYSQKALELEPDNPALLYNVALDYKAHKQWNEALSLLLKIAPIASKGWESGPEVFVNIGIIYLNLNDNGNAEKYFKKAMELAPGFYTAYTNLANIYVNTGREEEAIPVLTKAIELMLEERESSGYFNGNSFRIATFRLGRIYALKLESEKAISFLDMTLSVDPDSAKAYYWRALAYAQQSNAQKVMEQVTELKRLNSQEYLQELRSRIKLNA